MMETRQTQLMRVIAPLASNPLLKLGEAIFISQIDFLCERFGQTLDDNEKWYVAPLVDLIQRFPFFCPRTIKEYVFFLKHNGILLKKGTEQGTAHRIDLPRLMELTNVDLRLCAKNGHSVCYFSPVVAQNIGVSAAIVLQQTLYWSKTMSKTDPQHYDRLEIANASHPFYKSLEDWGFDFPFWHSHTIFNLLHGLQSVGILHIQHDAKKPNWYAVNYERACQFLSTSQHKISFQNNELIVEKNDRDDPQPSPEPTYEDAQYSPRIDLHYSELRHQLEMLTETARARMHFQPLNEVLDFLRNYKRLHIADIGKITSLLKWYTSAVLVEAISAVASTGKATWSRLKAHIGRIPIVPTS